MQPANNVQLRGFELLGPLDCENNVLDSVVARVWEEVVNCHG